MKIAIIHDWLTTLGGAEKVLIAILEVYPDADIFTLVADDKLLQSIGINKDKVQTSFINNFPGAKKNHRNYLPFFKYAIESFNLSKYDLIISSSFCVAKGVLTNSTQIHISYCHSPVRYAWDLYFQYLEESNLMSGMKSIVVKYFLHKLRIWDIVSSNRVDYFISNSNFIAKRIQKVYRRDSVTIYPNVNVDDFELFEKKEDFYFTCSRLVPYKKIDMIVRAFTKMPDKKLVVIGTGPDLPKIQMLATSNITLLGFQPFDVLNDYLKRAKAFVFAAEEDFGIAPLEAQACGTPVIAFGKGGSLETIIDGKTGLFYHEQTVEALIQAVNDFEAKYVKFNCNDIRMHAEKFGLERFKEELSTFVSNCFSPRTNKD